MKNLALLIICAITFTVSGKEISRNAKSCSSEAVLIPHEENCDQFYWCKNGISVPLICAPGLYFNAELQVCDWAQNVQCSGNKVAVSNARTCSSENTLIAHEKNCNQYYLCKDGVSVPYTCPPGLYFNAELQVCDWPHNVQCNGKQVAQLTSAKTCSADNVLIPHEENCDQFYLCKNGIYVPLTCAPGLYFNAELQVCDWPHNVQCNGKQVAQLTSAKTCSADNVLIPHEENCDQFYLCKNGIYVPLTCAPGLYFNAELQVCDWPHNVQCSGNKVAVSNARTCSSNNTLIAHEENCNQFYWCKDGVSVPYTCPPGLYFNAELQVCDWPHNVQCNGKQVAQLASAKTCSADNVLIPHEENCDQFYLCKNGISVPLTCAPGLYFNAELQVCDWPHNVQCSGNKVAVSNARTCSSNNTLIAHEENCNQFYWCKDGVSVPYTCPPGLYFNAELQVCDWPHNVQCNGKQVAQLTSAKTCSADNVLIPHEENCDQFYLCKNGIYVPLTCAPGLYFNAELQVCDWPHNVQCNGKQVAQLTSAKTCSADNVLIPHEENCDQFYLCKNGISVPLTCAPGLYFNAELQVCDWPHNVQCN